jgi:MarR family 2-MHQ and catechol resistance regulon transcriptional repressor
MGTHYKGTEEEVIALDAYIKLMRCAESFTARTHSHLAHTGLTFSQFQALEALFHLGPMCQRDIAQKILKSTANLTVVIDNLEKQGLVERRRDTEDRRFVTVHLTDNGRRLTEEIFPRHVETLVKEMSVLTKSEQRELGRLCRKLGLKESR